MKRLESQIKRRERAELTFGPKETEAQVMVSLIKKQRDQLHNRSSLNEQIEGTHNFRVVKQGREMVMERHNLNRALEAISAQHETEKKTQKQQYAKLKSVWEDQTKLRQDQVKVDYEIESDDEPGRPAKAAIMMETGMTGMSDPDPIKIES